MGHSIFRWSNDDPVLRPYPLQPLLAMVGDVGSQNLLTVLGVSGTRLAQLRRKGWLTGWEADRLAIKAGFHPVTVWGDLWAEDDLTAAFCRLRDVS